MNRRNLLKSLFAVPLAALGMNKTLAAFAAPPKVVNWHGNLPIGPSLNGKYEKTTTGVDPVTGLPRAWLHDTVRIHPFDLYALMNDSAPVDIFKIKNGLIQYQGVTYFQTNSVPPITKEGRRMLNELESANDFSRRT